MLEGIAPLDQLAESPIAGVADDSVTFDAAHMSGLDVGELDALVEDHHEHRVQHVNRLALKVNGKVDVQNQVRLIPLTNAQAASIASVQPRTSSSGKSIVSPRTFRLQSIWNGNPFILSCMRWHRLCILQSLCQPKKRKGADRSPLQGSLHECVGELHPEKDAKQHHRRDEDYPHRSYASARLIAMVVNSLCNF